MSLKQARRPSRQSTLLRLEHCESGFTLCSTCPSYDISTAAGYSPPVTVCLAVPASVDQPTYSTLKLMHGEGGALVDRTNGHFTDTNGKRWVCGSIQSLSPFALAGGPTPTATDGTVSGRVTDQNGHPVAGVAIWMNGTQSRETITDTDGNYQFDNVEANGFYTVTPSRVNYTFSPGNRSFSLLGVHAEASFTASANGDHANAIDTTEFFVRQQYLDFLGREPDPAGFDFWTKEIVSCGTDAACFERKRINVSAAFFLSIEFQSTGYLVKRIYKAAYGDGTGSSTFGVAHQLPVPIVRLNEFLVDTREIGRSVVVGQTGWESVLENNKQAFTADFVQRSRFTTAFPSTMTTAQFVDKLNMNAGNPLSQMERDNLVNSGMTRAQILRAVAEDQDLYNAEFNRAFVLIQYFGYLRRNPNDPQDRDYSGYDFWLTKLNQFDGNFINAEMVKAFITSGEYRGRFGP